MSKYLIWGTGVRAINYYKFYEIARKHQPIEIVGFVDNNPSKWGTSFLGNIVYSPKELNKIQFDYIDIWMKDVCSVKNQIVEELGVEERRVKSCFNPLRESLKEKYKDSLDGEIKAFLEEMDTKFAVEIFAYNPKIVDVDREMFYDECKELYYVDFEGKRMYLAASFQNYVVKDGKKYARNLWQEQDVNSPHLYTDDIVGVKENAVIVEIGRASCRERV